MFDKSLTIKKADDKELDAIIRRLRQESEAQSLIADIIRRSTPPDPMRPYDYTQPTVSTETPIDDLYHGENDDDEDYLTHFGTPGMKWGVRRGSKATQAIRKYQEGSDDYKKRVDTKGKRLHQMSNAEIKALNERMNLERQFKDLSKQDISAGKRFITDTIANAGRETAKNVLAKYMTKGIESNIDKLIKKAAAAKAAKVGT